MAGSLSELLNGMRGVLYQQPQQPKQALTGLLGALSQSPLGSGLTLGGTGLAPYGLRHSGEAPKGLGFFGAVPNPHGGYSTEISSEFEHEGKTFEHPLMVPTLSPQEFAHLLSGSDPTPQIYDKARAHALARILKGQSPFAQPNEVRYPVPR